MAGPDFDLPGKPVITEIDLAQRAVKDVLGRATDPSVLDRILFYLESPILGNLLINATLARLLYEERKFNTGEILLPEKPIQAFRKALINKWQIYFTLPKTEQQVLQEAARQEFLSTKNK